MCDGSISYGDKAKVDRDDTNAHMTTQQTADPAAAGGESQPASPPVAQALPREPNGELPVDVVIIRALDHLDARRQRVRDPVTGRWVLGNGGRLETGLRSERFWVDLEPARVAIEASVRHQLGLDDSEAPETALGTVGAYAEARLIRRSEFLQLTRIEDQPTTAKALRRLHERRRQHLTAWGMAFDRELKAAGLLGLGRRTKPIDPLDAVAVAVEEANR